MRHLVLVIALVGCGTSRREAGTGPDAGVADTSGASPDAAIDAGTDAGSGSAVDPNAVEVIVRDGFAPIANVRVVFDDAGGTRAELQTDASGIATADMPMGGNVTVIRTYPVAVAPASQQYPEIYSYIGVKPGEQLHVGHVVDDITAPATITVAVPAPMRGTVNVVTPCGSGQGTVPSVRVTVAACPPNVAFYVSDAAQEGFVAKVPYAASVDLSQQVLADFLSTTMYAYDVTPDLASVTAEARAMDGVRELYSTGVVRVDQRSTQLGVPDLAGAVDELVIGTIAATAGGTQIVATRSYFEPMPISVDASGDLLPYLREPATYTATGATWDEQGTGTSDAVIATIDVTRADPAALPSEAKYRRTIIAPYSGTSLAIPQLTGADATYNPVAADQLAGALGLVGSTAGYDALLPWAFGVSNIIETAPRGETVTLSYPDGAAPAL